MLGATERDLKSKSQKQKPKSKSEFPPTTIHIEPKKAPLGGAFLDVLHAFGQAACTGMLCPVLTISLRSLT